MRQACILIVAGLLAGCSSVSVSEKGQDGMYILGNRSEMEVTLASYGARITSIKVPDRDGNFADVVLGYDAVGSYRSAEKKPYLPQLAYAEMNARAKVV